MTMEVSGKPGRATGSPPSGSAQGIHSDVRAARSIEETQPAAAFAAARVPMQRTFQEELRDSIARHPAGGHLVRGRSRRDRLRELCRPMDAAGAAAPRALVAEPNPIFQKVLIRVLQQSAFTVDRAGAAAEVIRAFETRPYEIVLLDCDTFEVDGLRTASRLRLIETADRRTPILGLTSQAGQVRRRERETAGMDNYLLKPFQRERVEAVVSRYVAMPALAPGTRFLALDQTRVTELRELAAEPAVFRDFIEVFLITAPQLILRMRLAFEERNAPSLQRAAMSLKDSSAQLGIVRLQELCSQIETLAGSGCFTAAEPLLADLALGLQAALPELQALRLSAFPLSATARKPLPPVRRPPAAPNHVLLLGADPAAARFLARGLTAAGFVVNNAGTAGDTFEFLRSGKPAVVVLEIAAADAETWETIALLRGRMGENHGFVILSPSREERDILRAFELGADDYIQKPFNPSEVIARVRRLARRIQLRRSAA